MNIKKAVHDSIVAKLRDAQGNLRYRIERNKKVMRDTVGDQTRSKRELAEIENLIRGMGARL
jgi:hypothetical protein